MQLLIMFVFCKMGVEDNSSTVSFFSLVPQNMRVTRRIVLPLLTKALYKFGCSEGILQKAILALLLFY
jgi:hypothetical protein